MEADIGHDLQAEEKGLAGRVMSSMKDCSMHAAEKAIDTIKNAADAARFLYQLEIEPAFGALKTSPTARRGLYMGIACAGASAVVLQYGCGDTDDPLEECQDGRDNDGDGRVDSLDPGCYTNGFYDRYDNNERD